MAVVENDPDEGTLVANGVKRTADLVVHQCVRNALGLVDPFRRVGWQEDLVEPIGFALRIDRRLLRAVAGEMQIDKVAALGLCGDILQRRRDMLMRRRPDSAVEAVGKQRGVGRLELHRGVVQEIVAHQHGIVIGADQRGLRRQVRIGGDGHQHGMIGAGESRLGRAEAAKRKRRRREQSARTFPLHHFGCLPKPEFAFPKWPIISATILSVF
jgi:hypothetical protein